MSCTDLFHELIAYTCVITELVEVFAINTMAPFILNKRAIPLLEKVASGLSMVAITHQLHVILTATICFCT